MKIYISGPITGVDGHREAFRAAAEKLTGMGHIALNPDVLPEGLEPGDYMAIDMAMLAIADSVYMLPGFYQSGGSTIELALARYANKQIFYAESERDELALTEFGLLEKAS